MHFLRFPNFCILGLKLSEHALLGWNTYIISSSQKVGNIQIHIVGYSRQPV